MKKNYIQLRKGYLIPFLLIIAFVFANNVFAQRKLSNEDALLLVSKNAKALSFSSLDLREVLVSNAYHDNILNADLVYLQQTINGIPVLNSIKSIVFKNEKVASISGSFFYAVEGKPININTIPTATASTAILAAAKEVELKIAEIGTPLKISANNRNFEFGTLGISQTNVTADLIWQANDNNDLKLVWQVKIVPFKTSDYWLIQVDAHSGIVLNKMNLTVFCSWDGNKLVEDNTHEAICSKDNFLSAPAPASINNAAYRVIAYPLESPAHGPFTLENNPWLLAGVGNSATAFGWHNDGTTEYNITRGNNVWAKEDRTGDNETTVGTPATSTNAAPNYSFDFSFNPEINPTETTNQKAAITNLFYWNNIIHDIAYQYGFNEVSGNFQNDNQGLGGNGADYVFADAQDGIGLNNANFATPADGSRPRMQMFLFSPAPATILKVNSSPIAIAAMNAFEFVMSSNNKLANVGPKTGNLVLYDNGTNTGCSATANVFTGKIVLVLYTGACDPNIATKNAQNAGAIGVVMQMPSGTPANSYSVTTNNTVTIPSVNINFADGNALKTAMLSGTVNLTLSGINLDGDFDNGIVVHEYGHGISNRLTGGAANVACLQNKEQMGEGWSDYYALMLTTNWATTATTDGGNKRPIGNYALGQSPTGAGIRTYPYTTNMTINPWTYGMLATGTTVSGVPGQVHKVGEIWAATLWDMTWNIITQENSISANLYDANANGGNNISLKLVTQGLKLQPCSPGFLDGRNAILKADTLLYGGKYSCAIWSAFARRGMGINALQGSSNSVTDQTQDFTMPVINLDTTAVVCDSLVWRGTTFTSSGNFQKSIVVSGGCAATITLHLTLNNSKTVSVASSSPTVCINSAITDITHTTTGATSIGTATGLPNGVTAVWINDTLTISGTPTQIGTFIYNIPLVGGCGTVNATGTITVKTTTSIGSNSLPTAILCSIGATTTATNSNTINGGIWTSSNPNIVTTTNNAGGASALVTAVANGSAVLTYTKTAANACSASADISITIAAIATPILTNVPTSICKAATVTLGSTTTGGTWVSYTNAGTVNAISGLFTAVNANTANVRYTITNANGCSSFATANFTVLSAPSIPSIAYAVGTTNPQTGAGGSFCNGRTFTLVGTPSGGIWSSTGGFNINATSGVATTASLGAASVTYTVSSAVGNCSNSRTITGTISTCAARGVNGASGNQQVAGSEFTISPNPTHSLFTISQSPFTGSGQIIVTDLYGKQVKIQTLSMGINTIDVSRLAKGTYLISKVTSNNSVTQKLIVE